MPKTAAVQDRRAADVNEARQRAAEAVQRAAEVEAELEQIRVEDERESKERGLLPGQPLVPERRWNHGVPIDARGVPLDLEALPPSVFRSYHRAKLKAERNALEPRIPQLRAKVREAEARAAITLTAEQQARLRQRAELARLDLAVHDALGWDDSIETQASYQLLRRTIETADVFAPEED